jgi:hypothetical protein
MSKRTLSLSISSRVVCIALLSVSVELLPANVISAQTTATSPTASVSTQSTGSKIGTAIKDAIDIALPSVGSLIHVLFGDSSSANSTTTKQQATAVLSAQVTQADTSAKAKLAPVIEEADELSVLNEFSVPVSLAQVELAAIRGGLEATPPDWSNAKQHWSALSGLLSDISAIQQGELDAKVHTDSTRVLLMDAKEAAKQSSSYLSAQIAAGSVGNSKDASKALARVAEMEKAFHDVVKLVTVVSVDMSKALAVVANYAKANAGIQKLSDRQKRQQKLEDALRKDVSDTVQAIGRKS